MLLDVSKKQKSLKRRFLFILGLAMLVLYSFVGIAVAFTDWFYLPFSKTIKICIGILFVMYAAFRFYRLIQDNDDEE